MLIIRKRLPIERLWCFSFVFIVEKTRREKRIDAVKSVLHFRSVFVSHFLIQTSVPPFSPPAVSNDIKSCKSIRSTDYSNDLTLLGVSSRGGQAVCGVVERKWEHSHVETQLEGDRKRAVSGWRLRRKDDSRWSSDAQKVENERRTKREGAKRRRSILFELYIIRGTHVHFSLGHISPVGAQDCTSRLHKGLVHGTLDLV